MEVYCLHCNQHFENHKTIIHTMTNHPRRFNLGGFSIHHDRPHMSICVNFLLQLLAVSQNGWRWTQAHLPSKTISSPSKTLSIFRLWRLAPKRKYFAVQQHVLDLGSSSCIFTRTFALGWNINRNQEHGVAEFFWDFKSPIIWEKKYLSEFFAIFQHNFWSLASIHQ